MTLLLSEDQRDALQEVSNIAMGQAGDSLARLLGVFVKLSVPRIHVVEAGAVGGMLMETLGVDAPVTAIRQAFHGALRGEAVALYPDEGRGDIGDLLGYDADPALERQEELLLDVTNLLIGASVSGISGMLGRDAAFQPPTLVACGARVSRLLDGTETPWQCALLVQVHFSVAERGFTCHLIHFMPDTSVDALRHALDGFMATLA
ncbi:MAG: chemotaxis protein CheC [Burkholderiales bacterium]|nr:chemotaxis protein CheC [Burkholderiales bacterium]